MKNLKINNTNTKLTKFIIVLCEACKFIPNFSNNSHWEGNSIFGTIGQSLKTKKERKIDHNLLLFFAYFRNTWNLISVSKILI